jgi:hypothetical protein
MTNIAGTTLDAPLAPDPGETAFAKRGFHTPGGEQQAGLEKIGHVFPAGFGPGIRCSNPKQAGAELQKIERSYQGFAYEGCAIGLGVRDALRPFDAWQRRIRANYE